MIHCSRKKHTGKSKPWQTKSKPPSTETIILTTEHITWLFKRRNIINYMIILVWSWCECERVCLQNCVKWAYKLKTGAEHVEVQKTHPAFCLWRSSCIWVYDSLRHSLSAMPCHLLFVICQIISWSAWHDKFLNWHTTILIWNQNIYYIHSHKTHQIPAKPISVFRTRKTKSFSYSERERDRQIQKKMKWNETNWIIIFYFAIRQSCKTKTKTKTKKKPFT